MLPKCNILHVLYFKTQITLYVFKGTNQFSNFCTNVLLSLSVISQVRVTAEKWWLLKKAFKSTWGKTPKFFKVTDKKKKSFIAQTRN